MRSNSVFARAAPPGLLVRKSALVTQSEQELR